MLNEAKVTLVRIYVDEAGESHFGPVNLSVEAVEFAPPAPQVLASVPISATRFVLLQLPGEWQSDAQPAPVRQQMALPLGGLIVRTSDGEVRTFKPGDCVMVEDTTRVGHSTRATAAGAVVAVTQLEWPSCLPFRWKYCDGMVDNVKIRPGGRAARIAEVVYQATLAELASGPYGAVSIESIAARAGVAKSTLYRRWSTKERLVLDAMRVVGEELLPVPDLSSLDSALAELAMAISVTITSNPGASILRAYVAGEFDMDDLQDAFRRWRDVRLKVVDVIVDSAVARGELNDDTDSAMMLRALVAPIYYAALIERQPLSPSRIRELAVWTAAGARAAFFRRTEPRSCPLWMPKP